MSETPINTDQPLDDPQKDALGVAPLAKRMASYISKLPATDGFVIGLCAPWGAGKTTFINFIKKGLSSLPKEQKPIILDFNPWLFSGHDDLIQRFIIELSRALNPKKEKVGRWRRGFISKTEETAFIADELLTFAGSLASSAAITGAAVFANPALAVGVKALGNLSKKAHEQFSDQPPIAEQKRSICEKLKKRNQKILIVIDDIDRLSKDEILSIFRMVKSVADFPNVIYLLSFDRQLVCDIIGEIQNCDGKDYLEKIIQYDVDLPAPDPQGVLSIFSSKVDPLIEVPNSIPFDKDRWSKIYSHYIRAKLTTPRRAIKLASAFSMVYPNLVGELDAVDLIGIEGLRLFSPGIHATVRSNLTRFTELGQNEFNAEKTDKPFFEGVINAIQEAERKSIESLLSELFPRVENALSNFKLSSDNVSEWREASRICSDYHSYKYFSYILSPNKFADEEIKRAVELCADEIAFSTTIIGYGQQITTSGKTRIPEFLERFLDTVKAGKTNHVLDKIIRLFIINGDALLKKEDIERGWLAIGTEVRIMWVLFAALERYSGEGLAEILKKAFAESDSLYIPVRLLYRLGREHGKYRVKEAEIIRHGEAPYLALADIEALEKIVLEKIRKAAASNTLLNHIEMHSLLWQWNNFTGGLDEPKAWVTNVISTDSGLIRMIIKLSGISVSSNSKKTWESISFQLDSLEKLLDIHKAAERLKQLRKDGKIDAANNAIITTFIEKCDKIANGDKEDFD